MLNQWNLIKISSKREMSLFCKYLIKTEGKLKPEDKEMMPQEFQMDSKDLLQIIDNEPVMNTNKRRSPKKCSFNFWKSSYQDMHRFRVLRDKRLQQEHEIRMKNMAELQSQAMENLKLQYEFLKKTESQM
uniref:Uncharacterized protein n=1 Tax=Pararge aegeria TaxID=116150 RepID=S4P3C7_9NEOP